MRIISKFHDYYDSIQSVGYDPELVYVRKQTTGRISKVSGWGVMGNPKFDMPLDMPHFSESFIEHIRGMRHTYGFRSYMPADFTLFLVGFCGKYYLGGTHVTHDSTFTYEPTATTQTFYDYDQADEYFLTYHKSKKQKPKRYPILKRLGESSITPFNDSIEPFRIINAPCFLVPLHLMHDMEVTVNPCLADYQFYRLFDTYTAYQEIAMFLSGVLGWPENATVDISDTDMRDAKGFDDWSFKTPPSKAR